MPKRFPGMDPYLEGYLWPDVHSGLAFVTKELLIPQLPEDYTVRTELYTVVDTEWQEDLGILYPDVEIRRRKVEEPPGGYEAPFTPPTAVVDPLAYLEQRIPRIVVRSRSMQRLVTVIEYLSPVNKREPGRSAYLKKRAQLQEASVHLLEIDLIRRGKRPFQHPQVSAAPYLVSLQKAQERKQHLWGVALADALPVVPVPLLPGQANAVLDLGLVLQTVCERSRYEAEIDYQQPPPPPSLTDEEWEWVQSL